MSVFKTKLSSSDQKKKKYRNSTKKDGMPVHQETKPRQKYLLNNI